MKVANLFVPLGLTVAVPAPPQQTSPPRLETRAIRDGYEPPIYHDGKTHYERSETRFGRFTVERYVEDCRDVPLLDYGCWLTKEARQNWRDSSGTIGFSFIDNGRGVRFKADGQSADGRTICIMPSLLVGYDPKPSTLENWRKMQPFIERQLQGCSAVSPADLSRALDEMRASGSDYVSAAKAWKGVAVELFGPGGSRCVAERMKADTMPPRFECRRYSKP